MGGELLRHVVRVIDTGIDMEVAQEQHSARARLQAGEVVTVETRAIGDKDHLCGNEDTFYQPLTQTAHAMPAVAMTDEYRGKDLDTSWTLHNKRSAFGVQVGLQEHLLRVQHRALALLRFEFGRFGSQFGMCFFEIGLPARELRLGRSYFGLTAREFSPISFRSRDHLFYFLPRRRFDSD